MRPTPFELAARGNYETERDDGNSHHVGEFCHVDRFLPVISRNLPTYEQNSASNTEKIGRIKNLRTKNRLNVRMLLR